tara:strand:+ start:1267 stop:1539 length:273 start_codon:yes stop_codon:yes gene_type:complete
MENQNTITETMNKQAIIKQADETYLKLIFSNPKVIDNCRQAQRAIELTEPSYETLQNTEDLTSFNNAVRLFYKRVEMAYDVIEIYKKKQK